MPSRLFVSIDLPPEAIADLRAMVGTLEVSRADSPGHSTRLTAPDSWHITVAFIGDVATERVPAASAAVLAAAGTAAPLRLRLADGGRFGRGPSTVLWAGIGGDVEALRRLAASVQRTLRRARFPVDRRPLRPHLTLSRPGQRVPVERVDADVVRLAGYVGPEWTVTDVHLMLSESVATPTGPKPRYTPLVTAELGPVKPSDLGDRRD